MTGTLPTGQLALAGNGDVIGAFEDHLKQGKSIVDATKAVQKQFAEAIKDADDGPLIWIALADAQWTYGQLDQGVLHHVKDDFDSGRSLEAVIVELRRRCRRNLPDKIRIATIYYKPDRNHSSLVPDYYVRATDKWLVFPHEVQGLTREEILANKPVSASFFEK